MNKQTASRYLNRLEDLVRAYVRASERWDGAPYDDRGWQQVVRDDCQRNLDDYKLRLIGLMTESQDAHAPLDGNAGKETNGN